MFRGEVNSTAISNYVVNESYQDILTRAGQNILTSKVFNSENFNIQQYCIVMRLNEIT